MKEVIALVILVMAIHAVELFTGPDRIVGNPAVIAASPYMALRYGLKPTFEKMVYIAHPELFEREGQ